MPDYEALNDQMYHLKKGSTVCLILNILEFVLGSVFSVFLYILWFVGIVAAGESTRQLNALNAPIFVYDIFHFISFVTVIILTVTIKSEKNLDYTSGCATKLTVCKVLMILDLVFAIFTPFVCYLSYNLV